MEDTEDLNIIKILIATDTHLGYMDKDPVRGNDSLNTFEEILSIAVEKKVDMLLLGGDLFHDNKPSRWTLYKTMELMREYCLGERPCFLEILSDQSVNFPSNRFGCVNYEDANYNVSIPVFVIHGNHDDPSGDGNLCALDILSVAGLLNYFGRADDIENIKVTPILLEKGTTRLALYGLGNVRDERLYRTFLNQKVQFLRPVESPDDWFNLFVIHQNRVNRGPKNYIPESFLANFFHLVVWGHEHDCFIEPEFREAGNFYISQPGSTIATSLTEGEALPKHVGLLQIRGVEFNLKKILLKTVRPFFAAEVSLSDSGIDPHSTDEVRNFLFKEVSSILSEATEARGLEEAGVKIRPLLPLIRLKVEYSGGYTPFNIARFGQHFNDKVANPNDILLFYKRRGFCDPQGGHKYLLDEIFYTKNK
ncbi:hypothetical protein Zmor_004289 [Zophobas morio]|uniref:Mre11 DNA-binding domain-containing protein n=1 Tax=Zophobas morio TaxID=2755281 RepID=A0AA38HJY3_9CUCU|nr:hypothetical protein Zmor_004289 [Zophobas morio]